MDSAGGREARFLELTFPLAAAYLQMSSVMPFRAHPTQREREPLKYGIFHLERRNLGRW